MDEFKTLVKDSKIKLDRFYIRTIDENGTSGTISGIPKGNKMVDMEVVKNMVNQGPVELEIAGVYAFGGKISTSTKSFSTLSDDSRIFAVDVSEEFIEAEAKNTDKYKNKKAKKAEVHTDVDVHNLFWSLKKAEKKEK